MRHIGIFLGSLSLPSCLVLSLSIDTLYNNKLVGATGLDF